MALKDFSVNKNVVVFPHRYYARCRSTDFGYCEQWGNTPEEATEALKQFVEKHWKETWPEHFSK